MKHKSFLATIVSLLLCVVLMPPFAASGIADGIEEPAALELREAQGESPELNDEELRKRYEELLEAWRERYREDQQLLAAPCELGRRITRLPACTTPESCAAYRLWTERMPEGLMAVVPDPQRLPGAMPATAPAAPPDEGTLPRPMVWPGTRPCLAGR